MSGELSPASVYVSLLPVVEACVVVAVPGRVGEVRVAADEPEAVDLDPGVLARGLDAPATVKAILEQGGRVVLRGRARLGLFSLSYGIYRIESKVSGPKKRLIIFTSPRTLGGATKPTASRTLYHPRQRTHNSLTSVQRY